MSPMKSDIAAVYPQLNPRLATHRTRAQIRPAGRSSRRRSTGNRRKPGEPPATVTNCSIMRDLFLYVRAKVPLSSPCATSHRCRPEGRGARGWQAHRLLSHIARPGFESCPGSPVLLLLSVVPEFLGHAGIRTQSVVKPQRCRPPRSGSAPVAGRRACLPPSRSSGRLERAHHFGWLKKRTASATRWRSEQMR